MTLRLLKAIAAAALVFIPAAAQAQGAAPEMFGVREVIVDYARFDDPKTSDLCSLSRENIAAAFARAFSGTGVPALPAINAKPPTMGVARIQLVPIISTHTDENMDCISWISLSAENHTNVVVPPISTLRSVTILYWRQHMKVATSRSQHADKVTMIIQKLAEQFAQQYRIDQPPEIPAASPGR